MNLIEKLILICCPNTSVTRLYLFFYLNAACQKASSTLQLNLEKVAYVVGGHEIFREFVSDSRYGLKGHRTKLLD